MRTRDSRRGQAAIEFAIAIFIFALVVNVLVGFAPVFLKGIELQSEARCDAGMSALGATDGSEGTGRAADIAVRAHPVAGLAVGDPWAYPVERTANDGVRRRFGEWRNDSVETVRLIPGVRRKNFRFRMFMGGQTLVDDEGHLVEEVYMPAMGL